MDLYKTLIEEIIFHSLKKEIGTKLPLKIFQLQVQIEKCLFIRKKNQAKLSINECGKKMCWGVFVIVENVLIVLIMM